MRIEIGAMQPSDRTERDDIRPCVPATRKSVRTLDANLARLRCQPIAVCNRCTFRGSDSVTECISVRVGSAAVRLSTAIPCAFRGELVPSANRCALRERRVLSPPRSMAGAHQFQWSANPCASRTRIRGATTGQSARPISALPGRRVDEGAVRSAADAPRRYAALPVTYGLSPSERCASSHWTALSGRCTSPRRIASNSSRVSTVLNVWSYATVLFCPASLRTNGT